MALEGDQRAHRDAQRLEPFHAGEVGQVDDETGGDDVGAGLAQELHRALGGAAGGDQIVDENHPLAGSDRVLMHLHFVDAIFELIGDRDDAMRQLALLANRDEAGGKLMRHRASQDEAARLHPSDLVDLAAAPGLHEFVDRLAERLGVAEQGGDVAKEDSLLGIIGNGANGGGKRHETALRSAAKVAAWMEWRNRHAQRDTRMAGEGANAGGVAGAIW